MPASWQNVGVLVGGGLLFEEEDGKEARRPNPSEQEAVVAGMKKSKEQANAELDCGLIQSMVFWSCPRRAVCPR
jgi:hypothetical protein